jgi:hypothetical protein
MRPGSGEGDGWQNGLSRVSGCFNHAFIIRWYRPATPTVIAATTTHINLSLCVMSTLWRRIREVEIYFYAFLTTTLIEVCGQLHAPATLLPGNEYLSTFEYKSGEVMTKKHPTSSLVSDRNFPTTDTSLFLDFFNDAVSTRFGVLTAVLMKIQAFWVVPPWLDSDLVTTYQIIRPNTLETLKLSVALRRTVRLLVISEQERISQEMVYLI